MSSLRHSLIFCASCAIVVACSGSSSQDVLRGAASSSSGDAPPSSATSSGGTSGTSGNSSGNSSGGAPDGGGGGDCPAESEPNDRRSDANELAPLRCGSVSRDDPRDVLTFTLKPTTKNLSLRFEGRVRLKVEIGGRDVATLTPDSFPPIPIEPNEVYTIEIEPLTQMEREAEWLVELIES